MTLRPNKKYMDGVKHCPTRSLLNLGQHYKDSFDVLYICAVHHGTKLLTAAILRCFLQGRGEGVAILAQPPN